ncbi:hypothetical protein R3P38DRAFT_3270138 [Favolaschia claudopus]|uniref:Uncharacterized protein n=1 Tax=Favolaschia claudopus TaxID=2862362 RepID=A0AAW0BDQ2_9AGAR
MFSHTSSERPTLPPLHTLNLLPSSYSQRYRLPSDIYENSCSRRDVFQHSASHRRVSTCTSSSTSRTPSPTPSDASSATSASSTSSTPTSPSKTQKLTLVPSSLEDAEAVVVISSPDDPHAPSARPLLLLGPALEQLRHPQRSVAKGTRLHPYRFAGRRPSSVPSIPLP